MRWYAIKNILKATGCLLSKVKPFCEVDELTGVLNLRALRDDLLNEKKRSIALLNIDGFSTVNNAYGIDSGDLLLQGFSELIKKNIPSSATLYRCYGDEFAVLFDGEMPHRLTEFAEQMDGCLSFTNIELKNVELKIAATMGLAFGASGDELLKMASIAMMEARLSKRAYAVYSKNNEIEQRIQKIFYWQTKLKEALTEGHLLPYYQPLLNNSTKKVDKYECLIRLNYDGNIVLPMDFLEAAKEGGMLGSVTRVMISESFRDFSNNDFSFSVNITEQDLLNRKFIDFLSKKLATNKIDPQRVYFELLEGISTDVADKSLETLKEIKRMGCKLSVDDFGTEHSNFRRLLELEVDLIKIDGSFIKNIDKSANSQKIVQTIISFAKSIGAMTAAEFVHSREIQDIVSAMGVDYSQGYYIGIPTPKPELKKDEAFI